MKLLLDTHIFLWYITKDRRLKKEYRDCIRDVENQVFLSVASIWEAIVKYQLGKLSLPQPPEIYLPLQRKRHRIDSLFLDESSVCHLPDLPNIHRDPFDRILICQSIESSLIIITEDENIKKYPIPVLGHSV